MKTITKVGIGVGIGLAAILTGVLIYERKAKAALPPPPPPPGPAPQPKWGTVLPLADGSYSLPMGGTFAISMLPSNPSAPQVVADLNAMVAAGTVSPTAGLFPAPAGTTPSGWPSTDNGGSAAVRFSGAAMAPISIPAPEAQAASVWLLQSV